MKKIVSTFLLASLFTFLPLTPVQTAAAPMPSEAEMAATAIKPCPRGTYRVRKSTRLGKRIRNAAIAAGIGAAIGGGIGGGRGALVGLGSGAGGYFVYRYVRDRRGRCVPRYVRG